MKLNKLFTILMAAAVVLGFAGCKNDLTLAEKLVGTGGSGASGGSEVFYKYVLGGYYPVYFGYDKTTSKVTDCWIIMEEIDGGNYRKYCIPPNDKVTDIQTILESHNDSWPVNTSDTNYIAVTDIINSGTIYDVHYFDILFYLKNQVGEFSVTKNKQEILSLLKKNVDLVLPDEIKNNDLLFLKLDLGGTVVWDFTINKAYILTRQDDNTALLVKESELDLITKQKSDFPDNTTVVEVPNTTGYCIYYGTESNPTYMLQKVESEAEKLYKTADGKYIMYLPLGGA